MLSQAERQIEYRQINDNMMGSVFERLIGGEVRRFHFETSKTKRHLTSKVAKCNLRPILNIPEKYAETLP
jgi:hypothetical protein